MFVEYRIFSTALFNQNIPNLKIFVGFSAGVEIFKIRFFLLAGETAMLDGGILFTTTG